MTASSVTTEGYVRQYASDTVSNPPCTCCGGGPHVYGVGFELDANADLFRFMDQAARAIAPDSRIRITVEVLEGDLAPTEVAALPVVAVL